MKQRSTTPVSTGLVTKSILVATAVLMVMAAPLATMPRVHADQYDDQINALNQEIEQYQAQADKLNKKANSLQNELNGLANQKATIQKQLDLTQVKLDKLKKQIKETKEKIADNREALGVTIADLYVDDSISPLEMLASSQNIGDYIDKQTYRSSISDALQEKINEINDLKAKLEKQSKDTEKVLSEQKSKRAALTANERRQQQLLNETKGKEAGYQHLVSSAKSKLAEAAAAQRAAIARMGASGSSGGYIGADVSGVQPQSAFDYRNWTGNSGCGAGGYPYCGVQDSYADPWALYNRECVSYAAFRANQIGGHVAKTSEGGGFQGQGMAYEFASSAKGWLGATVNNTPARGAVAILPPVPGFAPVGHAMVVESVLGDGWVHVSQYNFDGTGEYSEMDVLATGVIYVHFP